MIDLTFGIDISAYQTNDSRNPTRFFDPFVAKEKGVGFAFIRGSLGLAPDKAVPTFARTFQEAGIPHGFYHCAKPEYSYKDQVNRFWDTVKDFPSQLPPVLDLELSGLGTDFTYAFMNTLADKAGVTPILYTRGGFWNSLAGSDKATWAKKYKLWLAHYLSVLTFPIYDIPDSVLTSTKYPVIPNVWKANNIPYTFWQYCAAGDGEFYGGNYDPVHKNAVGLDMNVYNGSIEKFNQEFGITETPATDPADPPAIDPADPPIIIEPDPNKKQYVKTTVNLRGRAIPKFILGDSVLIFKPGQVLEKSNLPEVYEESSGITWQPITMYVSKKYIKDV